MRLKRPRHCCPCSEQAGRQRRGVRLGHSPRRAWLLRVPPVPDAVLRGFGRLSRGGRRLRGGLLRKGLPGLSGGTRPAHSALRRYEELPREECARRGLCLGVCPRQPRNRVSREAESIALSSGLCFIDLLVFSFFSGERSPFYETLVELAKHFFLPLVLSSV